MTDTLTRPDARSHEARVRLLDCLEDAGYDFVSPTPSTHRLVSERRRLARPGDLRDVFGWGRTFGPSTLPYDVLEHLRSAGALVSEGEAFRSALRVSRLDRRLHIHSSRGGDRDAVFLGPDSYRFVRFLDDVLAQGRPPARVLDIGTGAGAGALAIAARVGAAEVIAGDINPLALDYMAANAIHGGLKVTAVEGSGLDAVTGDFDLIIANPPYVAGTGQRTYRDGGGLLGGELALDWIDKGLRRLRPGGRFALYTGSPVVEGRHPLRAELERLSQDARATLSLEELDPDVFGGTLRQQAYAEVERIAAVGAVVQL